MMWEMRCVEVKMMWGDEDDVWDEWCVGSGVMLHSMNILTSKCSVIVRGSICFMYWFNLFFF